MGRDPFLDDLAEFDDKGNPIAVPVDGDVVDLPTPLLVPSPLHHSPRRFPQSLTNTTSMVVQQVELQLQEVRREVDAQPPAARGAPPRRNNSMKEGRMMPTPQ